jgi:hypothetical protein
MRARAGQLAVLALLIVPLTLGQAVADEPVAVQTDPVQTVAGTPASKQAAWEKALPRLIQAEKESAAEIVAAIKDIDNHFDDSRTAARPFVDEVLGWGGNWQFVVGSAEQTKNLFTGFMDSVLGTTLRGPAGPDSFTLFVRERFLKTVFDPDACKRAVEAAAKRYATGLQSVEAKLLVDLEADLPDSFTQFSQSIPVVKLTDAMLGHIDRAVADAVKDAGTDFAVNVSKAVICEVGSNLGAGAIVAATLAASHHVVTSGDPTIALATLVVGVPVGMLIDYGVTTVMEAAGHDPAGKLAEKVASRLKVARNALVVGEDAEQNQRYVLLYFYYLGHPDRDVRADCGKAVARLTQKGSLGLLPRLETLHVNRNCFRRAIIYRLIFGADAPIPEALYLDTQQASVTDNVLKWAREYGAAPKSK